MDQYVLRDGIVSDTDVIRFRAQVYAHYAAYARQFAWRKSDNPYHIFISEVMLQQTQTTRVVEKYEPFLQRFPTVRELGYAPLRDVLLQWSGLGYNRRAQALHRAALIIAQEYQGLVPESVDVLDALPGIGPYTAGAICAFAFHKPTVFIETNIRTVFLHTFFPQREQVDDRILLPLIAQTVDVHNPRVWYYALMDYGVHIKSTVPNPNRRSKHYTMQSRFIGSVRQVRGALIRCISEHGSLTYDQLLQLLTYDREKIDVALQQLCAERLLYQNGTVYVIWQESL